MSVLKKHKLALVTISFWFLLIYIVAALLWWFIALNNQNTAMAAMRLAEINKDEVGFVEKTQQIISIEKRKTAQYFGEGISFLAVILIGAVFIYRATRKQIKFGEQQQNFMMAVTHELKTPIAITQLNLETIKKRKLDADKQEKIINDSLLEVNRLNSLCNNILWAAQLDAGSYNNKKEEINLSDVVLGCVEDFENRWGNEKFKIQISEGIYLNSDVLMMQILINNLIENGIKYSPKEKQVNIELKQEDNKIFLIIKDVGIGIADDEKKKVFEKFYRSGSETTRKTKGTGLGLYLCHKIVKNHSGSITIANNKPCGSIFTVMFN
jgi:signal transduction histidine kinase